MDTAKELEAYRKAWAIIEPGGSNPIGVAGAVHEIAMLLSRAGLDAPQINAHSAFRAAIGQLSFLAGLSLGPEEMDMNVVRYFATVANEL